MPLTLINLLFSLFFVKLDCSVLQVQNILSILWPRQAIKFLLKPNLLFLFETEICTVEHIMLANVGKVSINQNIDQKRRVYGALQLP
jgi:hypothetical protein